MGVRSSQTAYAAQRDTERAPVRTAVILAAGNGSRLQVKDRIIPKPLMKVGGLHLIERAILNLHAAGIDRFRVVIGAHGAAIQDTIHNLRSLRTLHIEWVNCPDYELGNGVSLAAGARGLDDAFVVAMADHVFSPETVANFVAATARTPGLSLLATDPSPHTIFDLDDATKVRTDGTRITAIGKNLTDYQEIDIGLFYFPAGAGAQLVHHAAHGATSVSTLVQRINQADGFFTVPLHAPLWQDVDTPDMALEAERRLIESLRKPTDGPISRLFNRAISLRVSRQLARWRIHPNLVTMFVFLLSLVAAKAVLSTEYRWIALGGLLFQVASIVDGCDGELSRLTFRGSRFGAWFDTITDNIRYILFFICMGISAYRSSGNDIYVWGLVGFSVLAIFFTITLTRMTARAKQGTHLVVTAMIVAFGNAHRTLWNRFAIPQRVIIKQDVSAFIAMTCALIGMPGLLFWICCYSVIIMTITLLRMLQAAPTEGAAVTAPEPRNFSFLFFLLGAAVLGYLLSRMPVGYIWTSLSTMGSRLWMVFAVAPLWFAFNALSLSVLLPKRIGFADLFYNQLVGEAINTIVPLAGLAGEPYKAKHLSNWLPLGDASRAIVQNKIIHAISGPCFSGLCCVVTLATVSLERPMTIALSLFAAAMLAGAMLLTLVALSKAPDRLTAFVLTRLKFLGAYDQQRIDPRLFAVSLTHKMIGRTLNLLEVVAILYLLGIPFSVGEVVAIEAFVSATAVLFVVVPQGIGVNEAGIAGAFALLGLPATLALSFGIIRRARVIFWALAGLVVHVIVSVIQQTTRSAATEPVNE